MKHLLFQFSYKHHFHLFASQRAILLLVSIWLTISHEIKHTLSKRISASSFLTNNFLKQPPPLVRLLETLFEGPNKMLVEMKMMKLNEGSFFMESSYQKSRLNSKRVLADESFSDHLIAVGETFFHKIFHFFLWVVMESSEFFILPRISIIFFCLFQPFLAFLPILAVSSSVQGEI